MLGDDTPLETGHLTLNPFRQMGLYSIFMLLFLGIAWGAVPINAGALRKRSKYGELFVTLAGP